MSYFDSAITPVAGVGANIRSQSGRLGGAQAQMRFINFDIECVVF